MNKCIYSLYAFERSYGIERYNALLYEKRKLIIFIILGRFQYRLPIIIMYVIYKFCYLKKKHLDSILAIYYQNKILLNNFVDPIYKPVYIYLNIVLDRNFLFLG